MIQSMYVLKTDTKMNPCNPQASEFFEPELVAYVVRRTDGSGNARIVTSWGHLGKDFEVGNIVQLVADQTGRNMGDFRVVAIVNFKNGTRYLSPALGGSAAIDRKLSHYVVK